MGIKVLRDESKMRGFSVVSHLKVFKEIFDHSHKVFFDGIPVILKKGHCETIGARGLVLLHTKCCRSDFFLCDLLIQFLVLKIGDFFLYSAEEISDIRLLRGCC